MKAVKENKVYRINTEAEKQRYLKAGYDIYSDEGILKEHSPLKKIAYSKYAELKTQMENLTKENAELKDEVVALKAELSKANVDKAEGEKKAKNSKAGE